MARIEDYSVEGYWQDGDWHDAADDEFDDVDIGDLDAIVVHVQLAGDADMYLTIHGADDFDSLEDLIETAIDGYEEA